MKMFAQVEGEQSGSRREEGSSWIGLGGLASSMRSRWTKWHDIRAGRRILDAIPESQLEDLGIQRVGGRVRWLDYREAFQFGEFRYRALAADDADDERA